MRWLLRLTLPVVLGLLVLLMIVSVIGARGIEADLPPIGRFLEVAGTMLHYTDHGSGAPIVLIHGASSNLMEFQHSLVPLLATRYRVLAFDRPGHGYSERSDESWPDPAKLAELLLGASEALGAHRPLLVGHSWAGSVVMSALVREPQRVAGGVSDLIHDFARRLPAFHALGSTTGPTAGERLAARPSMNPDTAEGRPQPARRIE